MQEEESEEEQISPTHITPPINPTPTKYKGMVERMGHLFDAGSSESEPKSPDLSNHDKSLKLCIKQRCEKVGMENTNHTSPKDDQRSHKVR